MGAKLIAITPEAERIIAYCARVTSTNQENPEYEKLFRYLLQHQHWSPFEHASITMEIETSRAIAAQILRHRSFCFQEFSQRYSDDIPEFHITDARAQATKNRQSSTDTLNMETKEGWLELQHDIARACAAAYQTALDWGIAREQARMLLPLGIGTRIYMTGNIRSWIHYCQLRCQSDTQAEHRLIAEECRAILYKQCPTIGRILGEQL